MNHFIAFCSPNGTTRHVAEIIKERLGVLGNVAVLIDLAGTGLDQAKELVSGGHEPAGCLWVGSPVYVDHMVPPVAEFLMRLPEQDGWYAVPFVTWGGVNSGVALYEMGELLTRKKLTLLGAAKVLAVHSSMWRSHQPLGEGHPDEKDDAQVRHLIDAVHAKLSSHISPALALAALDYQPPAIREAAATKSIATAKANYPAFSVSLESCNQCGVCAEICPARTITLDPYPQFGDACFVCLKCVRECPQVAIPMDMSAAEARIRTMSAKIGEKPPTRIFL